MSKLYDKYLYLKKLDNSKIYLIKSGIFYIALEDMQSKERQFPPSELNPFNIAPPVF